MQKNKSFASEKPAPLLALWKSPLTLTELKILDVYLAKLGSGKPRKRWVRFTKNELEDLLNVQKINISDLQKYIGHLGILVEVKSNADDGFRSVALFEEAVCRQDQDGLWQIDLKCSPGTLKYLFNEEDMARLSSRYSYLMFLYIERNRHLGEWTVPLDSLREYLGCADPTYQEFKYFHRTILKQCKKELEEKTSCRFDYTLIRQGRHVHALRFSLNPDFCI